MLSYKKLLWSLLFFLSAKLWACPCGCGASGPLVLYPGESMRFVVGLDRDYNKKQVQADGELGVDDGPEYIDKAEFAFAYAINYDFSLSVILPVLANHHSDINTVYSMGDPSLGFRYSLYRHLGKDYFLPNVQLYGSYKHPFSKGLNKEAEKEHSMDIFGNGSPELISGLDFMFMHRGFNGSIGQELQYAFPVKTKTYEEVKKQNGLGYKASLTLGYNWIGYGQLQGSLQRTQKAENTIDGKKSPDSDSVIHAVSMTASMKVGLQKTMSLGWSRSAYYFQNKNAPRRELVSIKYIQAI